MSGIQIEIQLIAVLVALACSVLGVFLVLRKTAMISDAISHSILPGIVIGFFMTEDLNSPLLILLAAVTGMLTVFLVEWIQNTGLVKEDTSIGIVFPAMFSIGIIMITKNAGDIHLDTDAVLLGELVFAPFDRWILNGTDLGPKSAWVMGSILAVIITLLVLFYKELKISTFDAGLAATMGFSPVLIHYLLMFISSLTIVGSFDAVGAVLVVGFMIVPAAMAYLLTNDLKKMLMYAMALAAVSAVAGYWVAHWLDASIAGSIMAVMGILFFLVYLFSPLAGLITQKVRQENQKKEISLLTLLLHLQSHEDKTERSVHHLQEHINWSAEKAEKILSAAQEMTLVRIENGEISITAEGEKYSEEKIDFILQHSR